MKTFVAVALVAMLALAATAEAAFCRDSSYELPCAQVNKAKQAMFKNCNVAVTVTSQVQKGACCVYSQKVLNKSVWEDTYSPCEKSAANAGFYNPLKAASNACKGLQTKKTC